VVYLLKRENEEYRSDEFLNIGENLHFEAEEFKIPELIRNSFEEYKVLEIEERVVEEGCTFVKKKNFQEQFNKLKNGINSISSTISSAVAAVAAVGVGAIALVPTQILGQVEFVNYYIDYYYDDAILKKDVRIYFDIDFSQGYYAVVENTNTNESKNIDYEFVCFEDIGDEVGEFEVSVFNKNKEVVETFDISVNPIGTNNYIGLLDIEYDILQNSNGTFNLVLTVDESSPHLNTYLTDLNGYNLGYDITYTDNTIEIKNISEEEFNIFVGSYSFENENYYAIKTYKLNSFNILKPSNIELSKLEVLNSSYATESGVPTYLYFDGSLISSDYAEIVLCDSSNNELETYSNITDLSNPIIFYDLPSGQNLTFKFRTYHKGEMVSEEIYETDIAVPQNYLNASVDFYFPNPGEVLITYNDDGSYNCYIYTGFANNSEFNSVYRLELQSETGPTYEYFGTDNVASFENIDLNNKYYSIIYKVFIFDGINYYAIKNFALASGSVEMQKDEEGQFLNSNIKISNIAEKTYSIFAYSHVESDALVEVILSTGETINYNFTKENMKEEIILDLTSYEYNSITIKMTVKCNPYYGMGDIILENRTVVGETSQTVTIEYSE